MKVKVSLNALLIVMMCGSAHALGITGDDENCLQCKLGENFGEQSDDCVVYNAECCEIECRTGGITPPIITLYCPVGKYGVFENGCYSCPPDDITHADVTSAYGSNLTETNCYISQDSPFYDEAGSGMYVGNCYYG